MAASKNRIRWHELPSEMRAKVEHLVGGSVVTATNCLGGFSPGFASRLTLTGGRRAFVKAMDTEAWPGEEVAYRDESRVAAALPSSVPTPRLLGTFDDGRWVILGFEDVDGAEPAQPWTPADLARVVAALSRLAAAVTPSPIALSRNHPRLGGWADIAGDDARRDRLPAHSRWAAEHLSMLVALDQAGLAAAQGESLVHFDLYPHNILMTPERVFFVDWPHARLGAPIVDLVTVLSGAAADGIDPEPLLRSYGAVDAGSIDAGSVDAIVAAHAGFAMAGGLSAAPSGLQPIVDAKLRLGLAALAWLEQRLGGRHVSRRGPMLPPDSIDPRPHVSEPRSTPTTATPA